MDDNQIKAAVQAVEGYMTETRRQLHQIPELGFELNETNALVCSKLDEMHIPYVTERNWVVALIEGANKGKTVALRADMDALPLEENAGPFASRHPGRMHACGHDMHTAILLGSAKVLIGHASELNGNVKLLFEPAEETVGGAQPMVDAGCLTNPYVDWAFGLHVAPHLPVGTVETRAGAMNAATDDLIIRVKGKSGHGAYPDSGMDAIVCAGQVIVALQTLISRNVSPLQSAVIHIGMIEGGVAPNVMSDLVTMRGTIRTTNPTLRAALKRRVREAVGGTCQAMGCTAEVEMIPDYPPLINHPDEAKKVLEIASRLFGSHSVIEAEAPSMGAEDFAAFIENTPGAFFHIGCANPSQMPAHPLHSRAFCPDERALAVGASMEVALVMDLIGRKEA